MPRDAALDRALDRAFDAAIARLTAADGPYPIGQAQRRGRALPCYRDAPPTLPAFFDHFCARHADRPFLVDGDARLSFAETLALARRAAGALIAEHGVRPGDRVGIAARNGAGWIVAYMAIAFAGGIATLLNGFWTGAELVDAIAEVGCTLVLADDERMARIVATRRDHGAALLPLADAAFGTDARAAPPLPAVAPDDDATILFTSGSTGRCKGAVSDHLAVVQAAMSFAGTTLAMRAVLGARGQAATHPPAMLLNVPLFHVTGAVSVLLHSFVIGRKLVVMTKWDAEEAMRLIAAEQVTYFTGVPLMSHEIAVHPRRGEYDLSSLRDIAAGGAPRPPDQVRTIARNLPGTFPVIGYGLTESNAVGCANFRESYLARPASTGRANQPLVEIAILGADGARVPAGVSGEIALRSVACVRGYWNRPAESAALFTPDGFLLTGDIGHLDDDGYLFVVDRKKDIIIRGGENIGGAEVEAAIYAHPAVAECSVFGLPHARYGEVPAAVVHLRPGMALDAAALTASLSGRIAPFKLPAHIWFADAPLPRLGTGKIDRRALRETYRALA